MVNKNKETKKVKQEEQAQLGIEEIDEMIKEQVAITGENLTEEEKSDQYEALKAIFIEGREPAEIMNLSEDFIENIYIQAYNEYNLGLYQKSNHLFHILCFLEPTSARNYMGLAATNHRLGNDEAALILYFRAYSLDPSSPIPLVYMSDCFMNMKLPEGAHFILGVAMNACGDQQEYAKMKSKCEQMRESILQKYRVDKDTNEANKSDDPFSLMQRLAENEKKGAA